ncbi:NAD-dependent epimerase/dehydratase family protein [Saliphagus sp. LR7]|uniref:NAD-dependent epimerase/dehydratase family protein n=1 Tax=Saliphagus sp. LR7 TaxID=2282654 RepID=UPI000DF82F28|nr:NAD-dependent epimerase/dehydratase family protein [Saliphagus sp. LR7]
MRTLVTGATGFVGINLIHRLAESDREPIALLRPGADRRRLPEGVEVVRGDILDPDSLEGALSGIDAVVHLAASVYPHPEMTRINVEGTENLLEAAADADVERVVFASTIGAHPEVPTDLDSVYQRSKVRADRLFADGEWPFEHTILYPTYILGPRDYRLTRYDLFQRADSNRLLVPPLYTYDEYNIVHVGDVVGTIGAALAGRTDRREIVSGPNLTNMEVLRFVARAVDTPCRVVDVPYPLTKYGVVPAIDAAHRLGVSPVGGSGFAERSDYGTLRADLTEQSPVARRGWRAAIADTAAWYREVGLL